MMNLRVNGPEQKQAAVREWVQRHLGSVAHELRVARVAKMLFDLTRRWHGLGPAECRLLLLAALLHDVGRTGGDKKHAQRGARMILQDRGLPLWEPERRRLAYLTRFHKGRLPQNAAPGDEFCPPDRDSDTLRMLLGFLRAADGLDSRSLGGPRLVVTIGGGSRRVLSIYGYVEGEALHAEEIFGRRKKLRLLEDMLQCDVETQWVGTEAFALVG